MPKPTDTAIIRFYNTFAPVAPLYQEAFPVMSEAGVTPRALLSPSDYRGLGSRPDDASIEWLTLPPRASNKRLSAALYAVEAPFRLLTRRAALNVFLTQPPLFYLLGAALSRLTRTPYVIHVMDFYPDLLAHAGVLPRSGPIMALLRRAARSALRGASRVVVLGRCMRDHLVDLGVAPDAIVEVPNWAPRVIEPVARHETIFRQKHDLGDAFVVMYSGNMGAAHELGTMLEVSRRLESRRDIRFVFVGRGVRRPEVEARVAEGATNVTLLDYQPLELLADSLGAADLHFISLRPGFEGLMVPSKAYGVLASGRPVLYEGRAAGEVARMVEEESCGSTVEPHDVDALQAAIERYADDPELVDQHGRRARDAYLERYQPDVGARRYTEALVSLVPDAVPEASGGVATTGPDGR